MRSKKKIQLNAPAGDLPSLMAAVDAGADSVYIGFRSPTNLRNLPGLNFSVDQAREAVQYAHHRGAKIHVTVNTLPVDQQLEECLLAVDCADEIGADVVIAADLAVIEHARTRHPRLEIHVSCIAGAADAASITFYREEFGVNCIVLPRVLSLEQIAAVRRQTEVLLEVMVFGVLCANYDGRCCLSSFITGTSAHSMGACAPAEFVRFEEAGGGRMTFRLNDIVINNSIAPGERTYPTPCKGRYYTKGGGGRFHTFQESCCLNALDLLPKLAAAGVDIIKIEGRQRSLAYVRLVTSVWREAIERLNQGESSGRANVLESVLEGAASSPGALIGG